MTIADLASRLATKTLESGIRQCEQGLGDCGLADLMDALHIEQETIIPRNNIHTAKIHYWMGRAYTKQSLFGDGIKSFHLALHLQEQLVGRNHEDTMTTYHHLGVLYMRRPQYQAMIQQQQQQYQQQQQQYYHFDTVYDSNAIRPINKSDSSSFQMEPPMNVLSKENNENNATTNTSTHPSNTNKEDPFRSLIHLRTSTRIQMWKYGTYNACTQPNSRQLLYQLLDPLSTDSKALATTTTIERIQTDLLEHHRAMAESIQLEKSADAYRQQGQYKLAIQEYEKACKLEEFAFGSTNPTLCWIWRKLALLYSIKSFHNTSIVDWNAADLMSRAWMESQATSSDPDILVSRDAAEALFRGDDLYSNREYEDAIRYYAKATQLGRKRQKKKSAGSSGRTASSSRSKT